MCDLILSYFKSSGSGTNPSFPLKGICSEPNILKVEGTWSKQNKSPKSAMGQSY